MKTRSINSVAAAIFLFSVADQNSKAADHEANIDVSVTHGAVGTHFSVYGGHGEVDFNGKKFQIPFKSKFTKLASRDDDTSPRRVTPDNPWHANVKFSGPGTYILDLSDWDGGPSVSVLLTIDGKIYFKGSGTAANYKGWTDKQYGPGVRQTDDREIAFDLP
jgi:hypothetical protein